MENEKPSLWRLLEQLDQLLTRSRRATLLDLMKLCPRDREVALEPYKGHMITGALRGRGLVDEDSVQKLIDLVKDADDFEEYRTLLNQHQEKLNSLAKSRLAKRR